MQSITSLSSVVPKEDDRLMSCPSENINFPFYRFPGTSLGGQEGGTFSSQNLIICIS